MTQFPILDDAIAALPALSRALGEESAGMAIIGSDGSWHLEQNGSVRLQRSPLPVKEAARLVETVYHHGATCCLEQWWIRPLTGDPAPSVLIERRPGAEPTGLSPHTLELLRSRIEPETNGLIFGRSPTARSGILLSLSQFLPGELIVYVGPIPPIAPRGVSLIHLLPPRHDRDRRELALLFDRASAVLFDGSVWRADIRTLFSGNNVTNRWLAVDAGSPEDWASSFVLPPRLKAPVSTHIGVTSSALQTIRVDYLARRDGEEWNVLFSQDEIRESGASDQAMGADDDPRLSAQVTSPIDHRSDVALSFNDESASSAVQPLPRENPGLADHSSSAFVDEESDFDVQQLMQDDDDEPLLSDRESGEIDVPGFVSQRQKQLNRARAKENAESTSADELRGERIDDELPGLVASSDIDEVEFPDLTPEQLRQTYSGPVDTKSLRRERELQRRRADSSAGENSAADADTDSDEVPQKAIQAEDTPDTEPVELPPEGDDNDDTEATTRISAPAGDLIEDSNSRTISVRTNDENDHTEATTTELGAFSKGDIDEARAPGSADENKD